MLGKSITATSMEESNRIQLIRVGMDFQMEEIISTNEEWIGTAASDVRLGLSSVMERECEHEKSNEIGWKWTRKVMEWIVNQLEIYRINSFLMCVNVEHRWEVES